MLLSKTFDVGKWKLRYELLESIHDRSTRKQKTVVFVHGTPWSSKTFAPLAQALLALGGYQILLYDLPGYGQSQICQDDDVDTSVKYQAKALSELLKHLKKGGSDPQSGGIEDQPDVIAHDIAGSIVFRAMFFHECRFRSLLLMDTNCVLPWGDGFYKLARAQPDVFNELPADIFEAVVRAVIRSACSNPEKLKSGWEDQLAEPWLSKEDADPRFHQKAFVRQIAQANDHDIAEMEGLYGQVSCPTKILWGANDKWIPKEKMERLAGMLKHCMRSFVTIPEAGHLIMVDQPERVAAEVISWLQSQEV